MPRYLSILVLFACLCSGVWGQAIGGAETVKGYTVAQKQLLVLSTAAFIDLIRQNHIDRDSMVSIACRTTGLPFGIAYNDDYLPPGAGGVDAIKRAVWYLHKVGADKTDLDSAFRFIKEARRLGAGDECLLLLGEYWRQAGNEAESKRVLLEVADRQRNTEIAARAWHRLGQMHERVDSVDLGYLGKSLALYQQLQLKEKEIELLWEIAGFHLKADKKLFKNDLYVILEKQRAIGFRHSLFADFLLIQVYQREGKPLEAMEQARKAMANMQWSGMQSLEGTFEMRLGATYSQLGKNDEAYAWYKKALEDRDREKHSFWVKSLLEATAILFDDLNRPGESLSLMHAVTREFPPSTPLQKARTLLREGEAYQKLNDHPRANESYLSLVRLLDKHPEIDPQGEWAYDYWLIINYYLSRSDIRAARLFLKRATSPASVSAVINALKYHALYTLDSVEGDYRAAMEHHILYKFYDDSGKALDQRKRFDELTVQYGAAQKDKDIALLKKEEQLQAARLRQDKYAGNWILSGVGLLLVIVGLLVYNSRLKQLKNRQLEFQRMAIEGQNVTLRNLVTEKEWLVKEIHHRVKNNFQTVMGLLGTQTDYLTNEVAVAAITDSQRRVQTMSLIHQKLYQSNNLSAVNMRNYIHELVDFLGGSLNPGKRVRFTLDLEPIELDLARCIPIGLILNEAITNAFKYAFPGDAEGTIAISFNRRGLTIQDNGMGLPAGFSVDRPASMGMNLIRGLCEEIGGDLAVSGENGTRIAITW